MACASSIMAAISNWERSATEQRSRPARLAVARASVLPSCTAFSSTANVLLAIPWPLLFRCAFFTEDFVECGDRHVHVLAAHDEGRQKTQHGLAGAIDKDAP